MKRINERGVGRVWRVGASLGALTMLFATGAVAQDLCSTYTIQRGDTLSQIADRAGVRGGYQLVYDMNANVLSSPNVLEVGQRIALPCADGSRPGAPTVAAVPEATVTQVAQVSQQPAVSAIATTRPVRFLTGSGFAPFTDENLPDGGAVTQMVRRSMEIGNPDQPFRIVFINDWGAHLTELLPSGAFDMGFPWSLPDCTRVALLSPPNARRCTEFNHSDPFYEAGVAFYTLKGSPYAAATAHEDIYGATICRPEGWFSFDLEAEGLVEPTVKQVWPQDQLDCWTMLLDGTVDVITYDTKVVEEDVRELDVGDKVTEIMPLAGATTLHVFVPKDNPNGEAWLDVMNAGLADLRLSGEWFDIVLSQFRETITN